MNHPNYPPQYKYLDPTYQVYSGAVPAAYPNPQQYGAPYPYPITGGGTYIPHPLLQGPKGAFYSSRPEQGYPIPHPPIYPSYPTVPYIGGGGGQGGAKQRGRSFVGGGRRTDAGGNDISYEVMDRAKEVEIMEKKKYDVV